MIPLSFSRNEPSLAYLELNIRCLLSTCRARSNLPLPPTMQMRRSCVYPCVRKCVGGMSGYPGDELKDVPKPDWKTTIHVCAPFMFEPSLSLSLQTLLVFYSFCRSRRSREDLRARPRIRNSRTFCFALSCVATISCSERVTLIVSYRVNVACQPLKQIMENQSNEFFKNCLLISTMNTSSIACNIFHWSKLVWCSN